MGRVVNIFFPQACRPDPRIMPSTLQTHTGTGQVVGLGASKRPHQVTCQMHHSAVLPLCSKTSWDPCPSFPCACTVHFSGQREMAESGHPRLMWPRKQGRRRPGGYQGSWGQVWGGSETCPWEVERRYKAWPRVSWSSKPLARVPCFTEFQL